MGLRREEKKRKKGITHKTITRQREYTHWESLYLPSSLWIFHTLSRPAKFISLFIYLSAREKCLSRGFYLACSEPRRLDSNRCFFHSGLHSGHFCSQLLFWRTYTEFHLCLLEIFVFKVRISHFYFYGFFACFNFSILL